MPGTIELVLNQRFSNVDARTIWQAIIKAETSAKTAPAGVTYIVMSTTGSVQTSYIGKTLNTMTKRYPSGPAKGGIFNVFSSYSSVSVMDVTLYFTTHPSLTEGWCYNYAQTQKLLLQNIVDPN
jgi:hypothetical protein